MVLGACTEYEGSKFRPVTLDSANVEFESSKQGFLLTTTVPYNETTISIAPNYKGSRVPYVSSIKINGELLVIDSTTTIRDDQTVIESDWGRVYYQNPQSRLTVNIQLNQNVTGQSRDVELQLGYGYEYVVINITQLAQ